MPKLVQQRCVVCGSKGALNHLYVFPVATSDCNTVPVEERLFLVVLGLQCIAPDIHNILTSSSFEIPFLLLKAVNKEMYLLYYGNVDRAGPLFGDVFTGDKAVLITLALE